MPRLVGQRRPLAVRSGLVAIAVIAIAVVLESLGVIDVIPNFGRTSSTIQQRSLVITNVGLNPSEVA